MNSTELLEWAREHLGGDDSVEVVAACVVGGRVLVDYRNLTGLFGGYRPSRVTRMDVTASYVLEHGAPTRSK